MWAWDLAGSTWPMPAASRHPGLLFDDAFMRRLGRKLASLPRLREHLNVTRCVTALAELTPSLKEGVAESRVKHTWCNVRDVEQADIKEHFAAAHEAIEAARADGAAVLVHCSRGVSRHR